MLILAASDSLSGVAATGASEVTTTLFGMELNTTTGVETYKVLAQAQLAAAAATIYTATANGPTFVRSILVVNTDAANASTFQLFRGGTAAANAITPVFTLLPGGCANYEDGTGWQFFSASGQILQSQYAAVSPLDNWGITGNKGETMDRNVCVEANTAIGATGVLYMQAIWLTAGTLVSNISFCTATTAASVPTHYMFGLFDASRNLLAATADQTSTAWAATTLKTLAVVTPYTIPTTGLYYLGIFMAATTVVTLKGGTARTGGQLAGTAPIINGTSASTGLTTAMPNPAGAITQVATGPIWGCVT